MNCVDLNTSEIQPSKIKKQHYRTVSSGVIFNPKIRLSQCHFNFKKNSTSTVDNLSTNANTQQSIHLGQFFNNIPTKPFGPRIEFNKFNNTNMQGDKLHKRVNFEEHHCLCLYIRDSPPKSFKTETTPILFDLNDC